MAAAVAVYRFVAWASNVRNVVVDTTCRLGNALCCCSCCCLGDEDSTNGDWVYREPSRIQEVPPYIDLTGSSLTFDDVVEREPGYTNEKSSFCFCGEGPETEDAVVRVSSVDVVITEQPRAFTLEGDVAIAQEKSTATSDKVSAGAGNVVASNDESANVVAKSDESANVVAPNDDSANVVAPNDESANVVAPNDESANAVAPNEEPVADQEAAKSSADDHGHDQSAVVKQIANLQEKDVSTDNSVVDDDDEKDDVFPSFSLVQTINNKKRPSQLSLDRHASPSVSAPVLQRTCGTNPSGAGPLERRGVTGSPRGGAGINLLKTASLNSFLSSVRANKASMHAAMLDAADFGLQQFLPACRPALLRQGSTPYGLRRYQVLVGKTWLSKLTAIGRKRHHGAKRRKARKRDRERLVTQTTDGIRVVIEFGESTTL
ncbi:Hypp7101 [Branchiostoma lanceolatum]|uniref:Hypp7101 protein n=1 Tax=Branchiostoma lanceolatum TaxID=7740 RepID=A0A8J9YXG1_BRALA|nr:Hypp7101 [Branchiostoma lanceolatum]